MKVFLAGTEVCLPIRKMSMYTLDTFWRIYRKKNPPKSDHLQFKDYLLDSGAFTFMNSASKSSKTDVDWDHYIDAYADYVKSNGIKHYFELDIDNVVGYQKVLKIRDYLESKIGWQSIPVWHIERGKQAFIDICKSYPYIAIGGLVANKSARRFIETYSKLFIDEAHRHGTMVHGLGYTPAKKLASIRFDTVDSTAWLSFGKFGHAFSKFNGTGFTVVKKPSGWLRKASSVEGIRLQGLEWIKF